MSTLLSSIRPTPLVRLQRVASRGRIFLKLESTNPSRSVKDQVVKRVLYDLIQSGQIVDGTHLVEACTGNLSVSLAMCCAALNVRLTVVMDQTASFERRLIVRAYGAALVITPRAGGLRGAILKARELVRDTPGAVFFDQFNRVECRAALKEILEETLI